MSTLRFKPAYNPYTEPSVEIFSYHEGFKKWVEVGNSGMFRPEMLLPMGSQKMFVSLHGVFPLRGKNNSEIIAIVYYANVMGIVVIIIIIIIIITGITITIIIE
ncbi:Phenylalanyl-tRNA synthetase [Parasponia andersonii]|uniref:Phenylalanyl-tRNA synthetase n=1 Tax=Parasponia andersonii TaxID=3476 RepID=A0A2P5B539_PARAD|nr:Phenylalanyl-tRNA synthetase [Parasponia andersonii]